MAIIGCKTFEKYDEKQKLKQDAREVLNTINLK